MTAEPRLERDLPQILGDLSIAPYPDYIDDVLATTAQRRQRPAWTFPERWLPMDLVTERVPTARLPWRQLGVLALIAVLLATALAVYVGSRPRLPEPFGVASNGGIAYMDNGDLYIGDVGTGGRLLLGAPEYDFDPIFSRDGTRILFARRVEPSDPEPFHLMVMDGDGTDVHQVTIEPVVVGHWADWSPDGTGIVLVDKPRGIGVLQILDPDGKAPPRRLAEGIDVDVPVFRPPDSAEILFRGQVGSEVGIYVMYATGGGLRALVAPAATTNLEYTLREPRYSPDGSQIAFHQWDDAAEVMRLWVMEADGSNPRELAADPAIWFTGWPVWSNDGTRIAVQRGRVTTDGTDGFDMPYAIVNVESGRVTETGEPPACCRIEWAPDDSMLLFLQDIDGVSRQVLLDPDGGPSTTLIWTTDSYPSWQRLAP